MPIYYFEARAVLLTAYQQNVFQLVEKYNERQKKKNTHFSKSIYILHYTKNSIKTFDFFTLYTTIPQPQLKYRIKELIQCYFSKKSAKQRYQYLVIVRDKIIQMFGGLVFQQMIGIPIGTNCASLLADLFLNAYKMISFKGFSKIKKENWHKPLIPASAI